MQQYLSQVTAINQYQADKKLVQAAQQRVAMANLSVSNAAVGIDQANGSLHAARTRLANADADVRALAVAAYTGVGFTSTQTPTQGFQTTDSKEMLQIVSQRIVNGDVDAKVDVAHNVTSVKAAEMRYKQTEKALKKAQKSLASAQHTVLVAKSIATSGGTAGGTAAGSGGPGQATSLIGTVTAGTSPSILGPPILDAQEMAAWFTSTGAKAHITVPIAQLAQDYQSWGQKLGVRDDIAFAQSVIETGYFTFPAGGQLTSKDNNFAGIGACDSCAKGWSFPSANAGAGAQMELLYEYATPSPLPKTVPNVIGGSGIGGCCATWSQLAGKWASSIVYGISIMTVYQQMLAWAIQQREVTTGLIPPPPPPKVPAKTPAKAAAAKTVQAKTAPAKKAAKKGHR